MNYAKCSDIIIIPEISVINDIAADSLQASLQRSVCAPTEGRHWHMMLKFYPLFFPAVLKILAYYYPQVTHYQSYSPK